MMAALDFGTRERDAFPAPELVSAGSGSKKNAADY